MSETESKTIKLPDSWRNRVVLPPTRQCTICEKIENPEANIIDAHSWICPSCVSKIGKLIGVIEDKGSEI